MITVAILENGNPLVARSAVNQGIDVKGLTKYLCDDGTIIWHNSKEGAVALSKKMLDTIIYDERL